MRRAIAIGGRGLLGLLLVVGLSPATVKATTFLWDGGGADDNWQTDANWNPDGKPVNDGTADVVFGGTSRLTPNVDTPYSILSLTYNGTAGSFTNGGNPLTIGNGGVTNNSTNGQTIDNNILLNAPLTFNAASGNLTFGGAGTIDVNTKLLTVAGTHNVTINDVIIGSGGLAKTGSGTLFLTGTNTYTGGTNIAVGSTLQVGIGGASGNLGATTSVVTNNGILAFNRSDTFSVDNQIIGSGSLQQNGTGTTILTNTSNSYTGGTTVMQGKLQSGAAGAFVNNTDYIVNGGTLDLNNNDVTMSSLSGTGGAVTAGTANFTINQASNTTYAGTISGTTTFTKSGAGTLILANTNTVSGTTTISGGTLQLGNNTATGSLGSGDIVDNATLTFDSSGPQTESGSISGSGAVIQNGTGTTTLSGTSNTYTGGTTVSAGTLQAGAAGKLVNNSAYTVNGGTLDLVNNGDLTMTSLSGTGGTINLGTHNLTVNNSTSSQSFAGVIMGSGNLDTKGTGTTLTLTGNNTYIGTTTIEAGSSLQIGNNGTTGSLGTGAVTIGTGGDTTASLIFNRSNTDTVANVIGGTGQVFQNGSGTLILSGANSYSGGTTVTVGILQGTTTSLQGNITDLGTVTFDQLGAPAGVYAGVLSSTGAVHITDNSDVAFSGTNTYSGTTTIDSGSTLRVGNGGATGALGTGPVTDNGSLVFNSTANSTFGGAITGTGSLTKSGSNTLTLSGTNSYAGGTTVSAGTLQGTTDSLQGNIANATHVIFNQATDGTYAGVISGGGDVALSGTGNVTFTAANTYTGDTNVNAGTFTLDTTGSVARNVNNSGTTTGTGTIKGNLVNNSGGTVTPGTAGVTGTSLNVTGTFTNASGSSVNIAVDSSGNNTTLAVTGTATLSGGTVNVDTSNGFETNHKYIFLTSGGLSGDFTSASTSAGNFILAKLGQDSNDEFVTFQSNFISAARTQNERAVAAYIDAVAGGAAGDLETVISGLQGLSNAQAASAFEQMSGDIHGTLGQLDVQSTSLSVQRIARHLRGAFDPAGGPLVADDDSAPRPGQHSQIVLVGCNDDGSPEFADPTCQGCINWTGWVQAFGLGGSAKSDGNAPGVSYNMGGTVAGLERWVDDCHLIGMYGSYIGTNVPTPGAQVSSINGGQFGGYMMLDDGFSYYTLLGGMEFDGFSTHRLMQFADINRTASSDYSGWQNFWYLERGFSFQSPGQVGYDNCTRLFQPFFGLQYDYLRQNSFTETGADSIDLAGGGITTNSLRTILGTRLQYAIFSGNGRRVLPELHAMWIHECLDSNTLVNAHFVPIPTGSAGFTVQGLDFGRDWAIAGTSLTWEMAEGWSMFVSYDLQTNTQQTAHIGSGGVGYSW